MKTRLEETCRFIRKHLNVNHHKIIILCTKNDKRQKEICLADFQTIAYKEISMQPICLQFLPCNFNECIFRFYFQLIAQIHVIHTYNSVNKSLPAVTGILRVYGLFPLSRVSQNQPPSCYNSLPASILQGDVCRKNSAFLDYKHVL